MSSGILCQGCGLEAPTKYAEYHQNIGALVVRFGKTYRGNLCKRCMHKFFWQSSLTTLFLGPWGMVSLVVTPFFLINNIARYLAALPMPAVPPGARVPQLDQPAVEALVPRIDEIFSRLNSGEPLEVVATEVANSAGGLTPGQVVLFVAHVAQQAAAQRQAPTGGFPVVMPPAGAAMPPPMPVQQLPTRSM
jgi:hypothetical protein